MMFDQPPKEGGRPGPDWLAGVTPLFFDFETFYSTQYSLTRMDPASYILDPLFEAICLGVASLTSDPVLIDGPEIPQFIAKLKQRRAETGRPLVAVSHNAQFDMAVMAWRYGFKPDLIIDTIAMSRTVLGPILASHRLETVAEYFRLPSKGTLIKDVKGMTRADIIANGLWDREVEYCLHDTWLCRELYKLFFPWLPNEELILHDIITRCTTEPLLRVDCDLLNRHLEKVLLQKAETLATVQQMGIGKPELMSNPKFADVLRRLGIEPPTKISPHTKETTYAFAKGDQAFTELLEHPNPMVRTVVEARLETKSTIEETRTRRFISIGSLEFPGAGTGIMPMPVIIGAAHTHRVGGGWDLNVQNLGRGSALRDALYAEDGYTLLVVDSKQIEARLTAWFCGQDDLVEAFREGRDVYSEFASEIFGRPIDRKIHKVEGFIGKTGILQLGYASGWVKFQNTVRIQSRDMEVPIELSDDQSQHSVQTYRNKYRRIKGTWRELDHVLSMLYQLPEYGKGVGLPKKCVTFYKYMMMGPTGLMVHFPELHYVEEEGAFGSWFFRDGREWRKTYGASLLETIAQHTARCIVMGAAVRLRNPMLTLGARLVHSAHDELVYRVPVENVDNAKIWAKLEMNRPPLWAPDLPLDCDLGVAQRYGHAK